MSIYCLGGLRYEVENLMWKQEEEAHIARVHEACICDAIEDMLDTFDRIIAVLDGDGEGE